ncbi:MAG: type II secretion system inner membrane protein GspF [Oligoflexia bacterium]|nr:type II secretion system inner membrane protein GspF [Oligoflexia bacterium]
MPIFSYKGIDSHTGKQVKANITVDSLVLAKQRLASAGILLIEIDEKKSRDTKKLGGISIDKKVGVADLSLMTRQLATLISAKIPLAEGLSALIDQVDHPSLRLVLSEVRQKINEGASLGKSLADYPKIFDNIYVNMVEAGEASGTLELVLLRLAEFTESRTRLKNKIMSAMLYPIIMACVGSLMMTFIFVMVIPKIARLFASAKKELPLPTKICIGISSFIQHYWWAILIGAPILFMIARAYLRSEKGKERWHRLQLRLPILGEIIMMINVGRFCSTLATLLNSGVPILTSLKIVKNLISNVHMQKAVSEAQAFVSEGSSLAIPLINSGYFPPLVTHMIKLGEKSGELENLLGIVAKNYDEQVTSKLDGLTAVLEPIMMILLGAAVAFIVLSVVVPMMSLNSMKTG